MTPKATGASTASPSPIEFKPPLRPHRAAFTTLCIAFALWVAALLGLYIKTVYPLRNAVAATAPTR